MQSSSLLTMIMVNLFYEWTYCSLQTILKVLMVVSIICVGGFFSIKERRNLD